MPVEQYEPYCTCRYLPAGQVSTAQHVSWSLVDTAQVEAAQKRSKEVEAKLLATERKLEAAEARVIFLAAEPSAAREIFAAVYREQRAACAERSLLDGATQRPQYSLRTLCRAF